MNNQLNNDICVTMIDINNSINKLTFNIERLTELFTKHFDKHPLEINITPNTVSTQTNQNNNKEITLQFPIHSKTSGNQYMVRVFRNKINNDKRVLCDCNDFLYRKMKQNKPCKHIISIIDEKNDSLFDNCTITYN